MKVDVGNKQARQHQQQPRQKSFVQNAEPKVTKPVSTYHFPILHRRFNLNSKVLLIWEHVLKHDLARLFLNTYLGSFDYKSQ